MGSSSRRMFLIVTTASLLSGAASLVACSTAPPPAAPTPPAPASPKAEQAPKGEQPPTPGTKPQTAPTTPKEKTNVALRLGWFARGYDAPYYSAIEKGYYAEEGLNVEIKEGQGSGPTLNLVAGGQAQFGMVDGTILLLGAAKGAPVKMVAGVMQKSPLALVSWAASGINAPKDLAGKTIGMTPGANTTQLLPFYLDNIGVGRDNVTVINVDIANLLTLFVQKKYDVASLLLNSDDVDKMEAAGGKVSLFPYAEGGVNTMSIGIVTHTDLIKNSPDIVRRYVSASLRGWEYAMKNPDEAVGILVKSYPSSNPQFLKRSLTSTFPLLRTKHNEGKPLGWMAKEDWQETNDIMLKAGLIQEAVKVEELYTNEFVPNR